ncbi:MAG TPA: IS1595 family transposase, partial [Beijerinckiaceae bacterium]|nr:IS1595 family transposase [Beijerinckiaceae bacterium]
MAQSILNAPHFQSEDAAFAYVEAHLWPSGPTCPHCGNADGARIKRLAGKTTRRGLHKCYECSKPFTVRMGTIFESSHLPLHLWLQVIHLMCASKKGISTRQIQRMLNCSMKTAWFLGHRIRLAMDPGSSTPIGGIGRIVEADETALTVSPKTKRKHAGPRKPHSVVLSLVDRSGPIRSIVLDHRGVRPHLREHLHWQSRLMTDGAQHFKNMLPVGQHESVDHSKFEWSRGEAHTNTLEGFFSIFKSGMIGTYQHVEKQHLSRYLAEF